MSPVQTIATTIVVALFLGIPLGIMKTLFQKGRRLRVIGVIISVMIIGISWFMILTVAALLGEEKSN